MAKKNPALVSVVIEPLAKPKVKPKVKKAAQPKKLTPRLPTKDKPAPGISKHEAPFAHNFRAEKGEGPVSALARVLGEDGLGNLTAEDIWDGTVDRFNNDPEYGSFCLAHDVNGGVIAAGWEGKYQSADVVILSADLGQRVDVTVNGKTANFYKGTDDTEGDLALVNAGGHVCSWDHVAALVLSHIRYELFGVAYASAVAFVGNLEDLGFSGDVLSAEECPYRRENTSSYRLLAPLEGYSSFAHVNLNDLNINVSLCVRNDVLHVTACTNQYSGRQWYIRSYPLATDDPALTFTVTLQLELLAHYGHSIQFG